MVNKQERRNSKYKYGGTKVCKAEEVRKQVVNPKIESFQLGCKLPYLQFGFQIYRSSRSQMFFRTGPLKNFAMLEFIIKLQALMHAILLKRDFNIGAFL